MINVQNSKQKDERLHLKDYFILLVKLMCFNKMLSINLVFNSIF